MHNPQMYNAHLEEGGCPVTELENATDQDGVIMGNAPEGFYDAAEPVDNVLNVNDEIDFSYLKD